MENVLGFPRVIAQKKADGTCDTVEKFAKAHPKGRYVVSVSGHWTACIDGIIYDTWDCSKESVLSYYEVTRFERTLVEKKYCFTVKQNCENCAFARKILPEIKNEANKLNLDMKIGFISTSLDKSKLCVYYTAEDRVDFRELIKVLGNKYKARIEMRQIGNRDEAKQIGAIGICGKVTCCKQFLSDFDKVSIKMAKNQNISLNPNKINGMCGRLLCCFKYEDEYYSEMQKKMTKLNSTINTPDGKATVASVDFLRETVTVNITKDDSTEQKKFTLEEIETLNKDKQIKNDKKHR
jgi:cell fate regulator YaaT (PSP1 superfamily)